ncbi:hypothetical protein M422DRAFT_247832 [Sphaerobolus stellatus SS14]|nr:hypothetical protein M422DRAFT_247832 [Sphaerobolus stellatus SS14]
MSSLVASNGECCRVQGKGGVEDVKQALIQLCGYARQILHEQLDGRFVIGFIICFDKLNIYLFDRSSVVATNQSTNIHTEPEKFTQVVACFSVLPTEVLGWDPTISIPPQALRIVENPENPSQKFISIRSLSLIGVELMFGRATIVLEVVGYEDCGWESRAGVLKAIPHSFWADLACLQAQIFAMKQSWQRLPLKNNYDINQVIALENSSLLESDIHSSLPSDGDSQGRPLDNTPYEVYARSEGGLKDPYGKVDDSTIRLASVVFGANLGDVFNYINVVSKSRGLQGTAKQLISAEKLGWEDNIDDCRPSFGDHVAESGNISLYESPNISGKAAHDAIHNIESIWWIFIHLALTREGPGKCREERSTDLDRVVEEYFDGSVSQLTKAKTRIFYQYRGDQTTEIGLLEDQLLKNFHPFFRAWHDYHNIHKRTLDLLQRTIEKIPDEKGELTQQEDIRGVKYHSDKRSDKDATMHGVTSYHSKAKREVGDA